MRYAVIGPNISVLQYLQNIIIQKNMIGLICWMDGKNNSRNSDAHEKRVSDVFILFNNKYLCCMYSFASFIQLYEKEK